MLDGIRASASIVKNRVMQTISQIEIFVKFTPEQVWKHSRAAFLREEKRWPGVRV